VLEEDERVVARLHRELYTVGVLGDESAVENDAEEGLQSLKVLLERDGKGEFAVGVNVGEDLVRRDSGEGEAITEIDFV
jgi:hypothetical protein